MSLKGRNIITTDYYSFGAPMPGRQFNSSSYKYGFNGQEKDDEIAGAGNINTAEFWQYDTRLGRRWNLDPKPIDGVSQYATFLNNPILFNDPDGDVVDPLDRKTANFLRAQSAANTAVRAQLNAQNIHQRTRTFTRPDGTTYTQKPTDIYYRYAINKTSNSTFQQALAYHEANRAAGGANFNNTANYFSFNVNKTEKIMSFGQGSATRRENESSTAANRTTTDDTYRDYTINLRFHAGRNDPDNDRVRIYQGTTEIYDSNNYENFRIKDANGYSSINITNIVAGTTNPDSARGKISIKVTNGDNASDSKPGAYVIKGTVSGF